MTAKTVGHTPGPWNYATDRQGRKRVFAGQSEIVRAMSEHGGRRLPEAERTANARLIAAAPCLLDMLRRVVAEAHEYSTSKLKHGHGSDQFGEGVDSESLEAQALRLIRKVTGGEA